MINNDKFNQNAIFNETYYNNGINWRKKYINSNVPFGNKYYSDNRSKITWNTIIKPKNQQYQKINNLTNRIKIWDLFKEHYEDSEKYVLDEIGKRHKEFIKHSDKYIVVHTKARNNTIKCKSEFIIYILPIILKLNSLLIQKYIRRYFYGKKYKKHTPEKAQNIKINIKPNIGINRDTIDKFYTDIKISEKCINEFKECITIGKQDIIIEPSAGDGSFSNLLLNDIQNKIIAYDIEPDCDNIIKQDFLKLDIEQFKDNNIHIIGNPPFGRQSTLAKQFIKKCCLFAKTISFILPKSFRKESFQKSFDLHFHLIKEIDLPKNSFIIDKKTHNVPCIFQIWERKEIKRIIDPVPIENGFHFVKRPISNPIKYNEHNKPIEKKNIFTESPDFGILRAGGGNNCGRISLDYNDGIACYPEGWLFIKLDDKYDKQLFYNEYQKIDWTDDSNVGARSISKPTFIKGINKLLSTF